MISRLSGLLLITCVTFGLAEEPAWVPVTSELLQQEKTGFGGLCGVVLDQATGKLWVNLSDRGMFVSADQGETWKRVSEDQPQGRTETPGCWLLDPTGKSQRMLTALVYGAPASISTYQAVRWQSFDKAAGHCDWCAIDWTAETPGFILALKHEAGGLLLASRDGGKSFEEVGKGFGTGWVFDAQTAVVAEAKTKEKPRPNLLRTTDAGKSFSPCGEFSPVGANSAQALPKWNGAALYWLTDEGLIATSDQGKTWKKLGDVKNAQYGPIFGKDAQHLFVLAKDGPIESTDGGTSWSTPLPCPAAMKGIGGLSWLEYDPRRDTLYLMKMGSDLYRLQRGK